MIAWYWIPVAAFVSTALGFMLCAILACGKQADECQDCQLRKMEREG